MFAWNTRFWVVKSCLKLTNQRSFPKALLINGINIPSKKTGLDSPTQKLRKGAAPSSMCSIGSRHWKWKKGSDSSKRKKKAKRNLNKAWYHSCEQIRGLPHMSVSCIYFCSFFLATNNELVLFRRQKMLEVINIFIILLFFNGSWTYRDANFDCMRLLLHAHKVCIKRSWWIQQA